VTGSSLLVIERILRERANVWRQIAQERDLGSLIGSMMARRGAAEAEVTAHMVVVWTHRPN
jgi:hypothetical protein